MSLNKGLIEHLSYVIDKSKGFLSEVLLREIGETAKSIGLVRIEYGSSAFYYQRCDNIEAVLLVDTEILKPILELEAIYCKYLHACGIYGIWTLGNGWEKEED